MVVNGDNVAELILDAMTANGVEIENFDVVVVAQKIISKAEGRLVRLADITPSHQALELAEITGKPAALAELILRESQRILRAKPGVAIVEHQLGIIHANAGIDQSNIPHDESGELALLLPEAPDRSAAVLRDALMKACSVELGVIISDSTGRPWRQGTVPIAIGAAGVAVFADYLDHSDLFDRKLKVTALGRGDQIAAAAGLLMGETTEACPAVVVRGLREDNVTRAGAKTQNARTLLRPDNEDMFR